MFRVPPSGWSLVGIIAIMHWHGYGATAPVTYGCSPSRALLVPDGEVGLETSISILNEDEAIYVGGPALLCAPNVALVWTEPEEIIGRIPQLLASRGLVLRWCIGCSIGCEAGSMVDQGISWSPEDWEFTAPATYLELEDHGSNGEPFVDVCLFLIEEAETLSNCTMRVPRLGAQHHLLAQMNRRSSQLIDRAELVYESCRNTHRQDFFKRMPIDKGHLSRRIEVIEPELFRAFEDLQAFVFGAAHTDHDDVFIAGSAALFPGGNQASFVQAVEYLGLVRQPWIKTVCEVGFNWGGSSLLWLSSKPDVKVLAFDLMDKSYSWDALRRLQSMFPNRIDIIPGDSNRTLSAHKFDAPCDLILVDADHTLTSELNNILLMMPHAAARNLLIVDDCGCGQPKLAATRAWDMVAQALLIRTLETWSITGIDFDIRVPHRSSNSTQTMRIHKQVRNESRNWCVGEIRKTAALA